MIQYAFSYPLSKALAANSPNIRYTDPGLSAVEPTQDTYTAGLGGSQGPQQLLLIPYGEGAIGAQYKFRLYGWWHVGPVANPAGVLWLPLVLAEAMVTLGTQNGLTARFVQENERFASEVSLVPPANLPLPEMWGFPLGLTGLVMSGPISYIRVDLRGCRKFSFDFAQDDVAQPGVFANLLWAPASAF